MDFLRLSQFLPVSVGGGSEGEQQIQQQVQLHSPTTPFPIMLHRFHLHLIIF